MNSHEIQPGTQGRLIYCEDPRPGGGGRAAGQPFPPTSPRQRHPARPENAQYPMRILQIWDRRWLP